MSFLKFSGRSGVFRVATVLIFFLLAMSLAAQQNPFLSGGGAGDSGEDTKGQELPADDSSEATVEMGSADRNAAGSNPVAESSRLTGGAKRQNSFLQMINRFQRRLYDQIAGTMQAVKSHENRGSVLFAALGAAFLYGLLHALGPGHRKTVIFSYFLAEDAPVLQGVLAGVLMALLHGAAAVGLILPIYYVLRGSLMVTFNSVSRYIEIATFGFIAMFGAVMLMLHLVHLLRGGHAEHEDSPSNKAQNLQAAGASKVGVQRHRQKNLLLLVVGSGLVPCPGAAMVLMFALSMQMLTLGLLAVGAMSLGMAVTISSVAIVTLGARKGLRKTAGKNKGLTTILHNGLEIGGYLVIFLFGTIMTMGML